MRSIAQCLEVYCGTLLMQALYVFLFYGVDVWRGRGCGYHPVWRTSTCVQLEFNTKTGLPKTALLNFSPRCLLMNYLL